MTYNNSPLSVVWLDLDDTLIDFQTNSKVALANLYATTRLARLFPTAEAWIECYERYNYPLWAEYAEARVTREFLRLERFRRPLAEAGLADSEAIPLAHEYDPLYLDLLAAEKRLLPGAIELLEAIRRAGVRTGILSNGFTDVQHRKIRSAGLEGLIDITVLSDDIGVNKPDRRLFDHAMERAGDPDPSHHLLIGDNPTTDIAGALGAGWHAIQLGKADRCLEGATAVATLSDAATLLGL